MILMVVKDDDVSEAEGVEVMENARKETGGSTEEKKKLDGDRLE